MPLGLGASLSKASIVTPGVVTDGLIMKHMYPAGAAQKLSDGAAYFDGNDDYIQLPFALNSANVTVSAWVMLSVDDGNAKMIFGGRDSTNVGLGLFLDSAERLIIKINGDPCASSDANLVGVNKWAHVVGTYDGDIGRTYINGVAGNTIDVGTDGITGITTNARIGINAFDTANDFEGYIANVGVWNRVLTQAEIKSIMFKQYADLSTNEKTSLVSFWNLDEVYSSSDGDTNIVFDDYHNGGELLGSEMAIDGNFDNNGASWITDVNHNTTVTISNNAVTMTNDGTTGYGSVQQGGPSDGSGVEVDFIDGTWYKLTFDVTAITTSNNIAVFNYNSNLNKTLESASAPITVTDYFLASNTDGIDVRATLENGESITIDNISVKKVNGNPGELK